MVPHNKYDLFSPRTFRIDHFAWFLLRETSRENVRKNSRNIRNNIKNITFDFDDKDYEQIKGTAMGTKLTLACVTLTLEYLEEILYDKSSEYLDSNFTDNIESN